MPFDVVCERRLESDDKKKSYYFSIKALPFFGSSWHRNVLICFCD